MALEPCRECGHEVSTEAQRCPNCGTPSPTGQPAQATGAASTPSSRRWWVIAGAVLAVVLAVPLLTYGTVSPCEMLRNEVMRGAMAEAAASSDKWAPLGTAIAGNLADPATAGLSPIECLAALPEARAESEHLADGAEPTERQRAAYIAALRAELMVVGRAQRRFFDRRGRYAFSTDELDFVAADPTTRVAITRASEEWWSAAASHERWRGGNCVIARGSVPDGFQPITKGGEQYGIVNGGRPLCD